MAGTKLVNAGTNFDPPQQVKYTLSRRGNISSWTLTLQVNHDKSMNSAWNLSLADADFLVAWGVCALTEKLLNPMFL